MIHLQQWAERNHITPEALAELHLILSVPDVRPPTGAAGSEAGVQSALRLAASKAGGRLWRNNVGAGEVGGQFMRWGLANDSKQMNGIVKSADLIGIWPVVIQPRHIGQTLGQFWSVEVKRPGWHYTGTKREVAQLTWRNHILSLGGLASFNNTGRIDIDAPVS
jgi:hypothetical protein